MVELKNGSGKATVSSKLAEGSSILSSKHKKGKNVVLERLLTHLGPNEGEREPASECLCNCDLFKR